MQTPKQRWTEVEKKKVCDIRCNKNCVTVHRHAPFQNSGTPVRCASAQTSVHVQSGACGVCVGHAFDEAGNCPRMWSANHKSTLDSLKAQVIRRTKSHLRIGGETTLQTYNLRINIFGESLLEYSPSFRSDFLLSLAGLDIVLHIRAGYRFSQWWHLRCSTAQLVFNIWLRNMTNRSLSRLWFNKVIILLTTIWKQTCPSLSPAHIRLIYLRCERRPANALARSSAQKRWINA